MIFGLYTILLDLVVLEEFGRFSRTIFYQIKFLLEFASEILY